MVNFSNLSRLKLQSLGLFINYISNSFLTNNFKSFRPTLDFFPTISRSNNPNFQPYLFQTVNSPIPLFSSIQHHTGSAPAHVQYTKLSTAFSSWPKKPRKAKQVRKKWFSSSLQRPHFASSSSPRENNVFFPRRSGVKSTPTQLPILVFVFFTRKSQRTRKIPSKIAQI